MATSTSPTKAYTDDHGIERATKQQQEGAADELAEKAPAVGHLMRMNERFAAQGGNQFAAGVTYFSVLSLFPLLMLVFAGLGFFLNARPDLMQQIQDQVTQSIDGDLGDMVNDLIASAIDQRGAVTANATTNRTIRPIRPSRSHSFFVTKLPPSSASRFHMADTPTRRLFIQPRPDHRVVSKPIPATAPR